MACSVLLCIPQRIGLDTTIKAHPLVGCKPVDNYSRKLQYFLDFSRVLLYTKDSKQGSKYMTKNEIKLARKELARLTAEHDNAPHHHGNIWRLDLHLSPYWKTYRCTFCTKVYAVKREVVA